MTSAKLVQTSTLCTVYFDGLCHLCSREISHYQSMKGAESIRFVDITAAEFDAVLENVDPVLVHKTMHVRDTDGKLHQGVDAFICIWGHLPTLRFLVPLANLPPVQWALRLIYSAFAKIRPLLPRKSCSDSPYCETKPK